MTPTRIQKQLTRKYLLILKVSLIGILLTQTGKGFAQTSNSNYPDAPSSTSSSSSITKPVSISPGQNPFTAVFPQDKPSSEPMPLSFFAGYQSWAEKQPRRAVAIQYDF